MASSKQILQIIVQAVDKASKTFERIKTSLTGIDKEVEKTNKSMMKFLGGGLTLLFTGMALKRFFVGALRSMFNTYVKIIDVNDIFLQKTQQLRAAWEFFKFSLIEALSQSDLFMSLVDGLIALVNWMGQLTPETKSALGITLLLGAAFGTLMMVGGQALLFIFGLSMLIGVPMAAIAVAVLLIIGLIITLAFIWTSKMSKTKKIMWTLVAVILVVSLALAVMFGAAAIPFVIIGLLIAVAIALFALLAKKVGSIGNAFKVLGATILWVLGWVFDGIAEFLLAPLRLVIMLINLAIRAANALGANFSQIQIPPWLEAGFIGRTIEAKIIGSEFLAGARENMKSEEEGPGFRETLGDLIGGITDKVKEGVKEGLSESGGIIPSPDQ